MDKRASIISVLRFGLALAAYGYLAYRLVHFEHYAELADSLSEGSVVQLLSLVLAIALMPLNVWLEAWRWRYMMRSVEPMTMREAQRQVYYGHVGALLTPYRLGDFPARASMMREPQHRASAILMGVVSGMTLTLAIGLWSLPSACIYFASSAPAYLWPAIAVLVLLAVGIGLLSKRREAKGNVVRRYTLHEWIVSIAQSSLRYLCFSLQLYLMLLFVGIRLSPSEALIALPTYYLLITLTPNIPAAELGIRGSWAVVILGAYRPEMAAAAVLATALVWMVNTIPPVIIGTLIHHQSSLFNLKSKIPTI